MTTRHAPIATGMWAVMALAVGLAAIDVSACAGASSPSPEPPRGPSGGSPGGPSGGPPAAPDLLVYFLDQDRYAGAVPPYEVLVRRPGVGITSVDDRALATIEAVFVGPTPGEAAQGLTAVTSGFTGVREVRLIDAVAHVYLDGTCAGGGATYTIANLISANLLPFPEIEWVKVYDENDDTEVPTGSRDSIPICLEP